MKYPVIPAAEVLRVSEALVAGNNVDPFAAVQMVGRGPDIELPDLAKLSAEMQDALTEFSASEDAGDPDLFEGQQSPALHQALSDLPLHVLDDPGFWAYLSLVHFWWLAIWREANTFTKEPAKYLPYVDGRRTTECVLTRMFIRGQIAQAAGDYDLAHAVQRGTDFWRSHILRVTTGSVPSVSRSFILEQAGEHRMTTKPLRAYARRLNRLSTNIVLDVYDDGDADELIEELRES